MKKTINIIRKYLPEKQCDELNSWLIKNIQEGKISHGLTDRAKKFDPLRYSSRIGKKDYEYPQLVRDIHSKIEKDFNLCKWHFPEHEHGKDSVVVTAILSKGSVFEHIDPTIPGKETLRCNILTSECEGGEIIVAGQKVILHKGDMMQYLVSKYYHEVLPIKVKDGDFRIMWMFGWYVDGEEWENSINI